MGSEDLAEYAVVSSRLLLYRVEPVRVVRLCLRVGFSRLMRRIIVCQEGGLVYLSYMRDSMNGEPRICT